MISILMSEMLLQVEPIVEAPVEAEKAPEPAESAAPPKKKKKGNLWQRMVRAVRKRFGRNERQSTTA